MFRSSVRLFSSQQAFPPPAMPRMTNTIVPRPGGKVRLPSARVRATTTGLLYASNGKSYAMPVDMADRFRKKYLFRNAAMAIVLSSFVVGVYWYSIWAVRQEDLSDEFLAQVLAAEAQERLTEKQ